MKRFAGNFAIGLALVTALLVPSASAEKRAGKPGPDAPALGKVIPGQYIVVLKDGVSSSSLLANFNISADYTYSSVLNGFAAALSDQQVKELSANPNVAYVEQDQVVTLDAETADVTQTGATWGLDRIDQRNRPLSGSYTYNTTASNVTAYIIDTGLANTHSDFGGRATNVFNSAGGSSADCNGHGTHVGGTVGGTRYGVAKGVRLRGVKVLACNGSGSNSGVIAGMDYVRNNAVKPAVANMSLGGGYSAASNTAATNLANSGVFLAVAAGNSNQNACNFSPASANGALSVAASDSSDRKASFSNYGSCVDVYAPGVSITSTWLNNGTNSISGTSMASPHAAGVGALYKGANGEASSATIVNWIINNSTANVITGNVSGTPNRLLYKGGF